MNYFLLTWQNLLAWQNHCSSRVSKRVTISKAALLALHLEVGEVGIALGWWRPWSSHLSQVSELLLTPFLGLNAPTHPSQLTRAHTAFCPSPSSSSPLLWLPPFPAYLLMPCPSSVSLFVLGGRSTWGWEQWGSTSDRHSLALQMRFPGLLPSERPNPCTANPRHPSSVPSTGPTQAALQPAFESWRR